MVPNPITNSFRLVEEEFSRSPLLYKKIHDIPNSAASVIISPVTVVSWPTICMEAATCLRVGKAARYQSRYCKRGSKDLRQCGQRNIAIIL